MNENVGGVVVLYNASSALGVLVLLVFSLPLPSLSLPPFFTAKIISVSG